MKKIVVISQRKSTSAQLGIINQLAHIEEKGRVSFSFLDLFSLNPFTIAHADLIIFVRSSDYLEKEIFDLCKSSGKKLIYYLDDDLLNIPLYSLSFQYYSSPSIRENIEYMINNCDIFWTNNKNIAKIYSELFKIKHIVLTDIITNLTHFKTKTSYSYPIKIGISGSLDHSYFYNTFLPIIIRKINSLHGEKVLFYSIGVKIEACTDIVNSIDYCNNYEEYKKILTNLNLDIALAPLPENKFSSCKYYNKYLDYGELGIVGIFSDVAPYSFVIENRINGFLVKNEIESWIHVINSIVSFPDLLVEIQKNLRDQLDSKFSPQEILPKIEMEIIGSDSLCLKKGEPILSLKITYMMLKSIFMRLYQTIWHNISHYLIHIK